MTNKYLKPFMALFLALLGMTQSAMAFTDIKADFTNGSFFTSEETNVTTAGLKMNADGTFTRVAADAADANAVITGKYHSNEHGLGNFSATVKVDGPVKVSMGTCAWGGDVTIKDASGATVGTFNTNTGACFHQNKETNIASTFYKGEATTLTISGGSYTPYFAVEAVNIADIPSDIKVTFQLGDGATAIGKLPESITAEIGKEFTLPKNFTLYDEGKTLTGWTDGTNTYAPGATVKAGEKDLALTAVFTANEVSLADRTEPVTLKWTFRRDEGAPTVGYQNQTGVWVTQVTINGKTIDVKADFDTNNGGKFANGNWNDWAQLNSGTKWTIPSCKGTTISMEAYSDITTTTIDGQTDYTQGKTISYTIAGPAETVDIVIGDGSYYRYIQAVLPVAQSAEGKTFDNVAANIIWPLSDVDEYATPNTAEPEGGFTLTTVNVGDFTATIAAPSAGANKDVKMLKLQPTGGDNTTIEFIAKPYRGLTFTPTKVSAKVARFGTDGGTLDVIAKNAEGMEIILAQGLIPARDNKDQASDAKGSDPNYTTEFTFDIPATLATSESFTLAVIENGLATNKQWGIGDVHFEGTINGTTAAVTKYTFAAQASPEKGGSVNVYPAGTEFDEGTELKLTATKNFGYKFINWTDAEGKEVSTDNVFNYTLSSNAVLTANFEAIKTYALNLTVDGSNDYMVEISPAATIIDGKNMYEEGTAVQLIATHYDDLVTFTNWSDGETNSEKTVTMNQDVNLTATYAEADIIAGWDFYRAGSSGRKADFAAEDNDADVLNLVNTADPTQVSGWLDKSTVAGGGYESFKGAAVNWRTGASNGDVGNWHWQTKINAEAFTDINVQFQMLYNYNAYQTYNAEYSLDGENWNKFGSISMTGAKAAASFSEKLPEACNNQKELYIRMIADKTSNIDGSASANDGNTLAMFFITGTPKLIDDGTAPVLVSTVPQNNATGASATGKIVLTFDERVKVKDGAKATLGTDVLTPSVSGKTVTFDYKSLAYGTSYTFTLPANSVSDLTDNYVAKDITLTFTTMTRPTVTKKLYDFIVPDNGTFKEALAAAAARTDKSQRYRIFVKKGNYVIPANQDVKVTGNDGKQYADPKTSFGSPNVSIIGENPETTSITNEMPNSLSDNPDAGKGGVANPLEGIRTSGVLYLTSGAQNTYFQDIKLWSATADGTGRNVVLVDGGNKTVCKNVTLWAYQDTYVSDNTQNLYYFEGGLLRGRTDFLCGSGDVFYNNVTLQMCEEGGYIAVPRDNVKYGYVFKDCTIKGETNKVDGNYYLGRPWTEGAEVYFIDTKMEAVPKGEGWAEMSDGGCTRMAEYNSTTATGSVVDLSSRAKTLGKKTPHPNNPILSAEEAAEIGNLHNMFGDWDPTLLTEQAPLVTDVKFEGTTISWTGNDYSLLYAICKDGEVVGFTTESEIDVTTLANASAPLRHAATEAESWTVRAANEMGGLSGEVGVNGPVTGINTTKAVIENNLTDGAIYTLQGVRVTNPTKGIYIINGRKAVIK